MTKRTIFFPNELIATLEQFGDGALFTADKLDLLPPGKGAYLLVMAIETSFDLAIKTLADPFIEPGIYIYCGSARGPGGIKARLKRHFARDKRLHWHIDHLSVQAADVRALAIFEGDECDLTSALMQSAGFTFPINRFGASDCQNCPSHLLHWSEGNKL